MSSPAKRRKKNDNSSQPVRGLDYFFAKQLERTKETSSKESTTAASEKAENDIESGFTDEDLARKLQEEYNREYQEHVNEASARSSQSPEKPSKDETLETSSSVLTSRSSGVKTLALQSTSDDEDLITANLPLDENPLTFDPSKYVSDLQSHWAADKGHATYALLTRCFVLVNATTSRIKIVDTLVNTVRTIIESDPDSLLPAVRIIFHHHHHPFKVSLTVKRFG
jgi:DNA ligase 1